MMPLSLLLCTYSIVVPIKNNAPAYCVLSDVFIEQGFVYRLAVTAHAFQDRNSLQECLEHSAVFEEFARVDRHQLDICKAGIKKTLIFDNAYGHRLIVFLAAAEDEL